MREREFFFFANEGKRIQITCPVNPLDYVSSSGFERPPMDDGSMQVLLSTFKVRRYISRFQIVALKQDNQNQASRSKRIMKEEKLIR